MGFVDGEPAAEVEISPFQQIRTAATYQKSSEFLRGIFRVAAGRGLPLRSQSWVGTCRFQDTSFPSSSPALCMDTIYIEVDHLVMALSIGSSLHYCFPACCCRNDTVISSFRSLLSRPKYRCHVPVVKKK